MQLQNKLCYLLLLLRSNENKYEAYGGSLESSLLRPCCETNDEVRLLDGWEGSSESSSVRSIVTNDMVWGEFYLIGSLLNARKN